MLGNFYKFKEIDDEIDTCPLETMQSLKQQVREEVVDEIRIEIDTTTHLAGQAILYDKVNRILDQVRGENNVKD